MPHRPPGAADARQVDADNSLAAGGTHRPAAIALELDAVLRHEDAPATTRPRANGGPMLGQRGRRAGNSQCNRVAQGAAVAGGLQAQRIGIGHAMAAIELEGDLVERATPTPPADSRRSLATPRAAPTPPAEPMRSLATPRAASTPPAGSMRS